MVYKYGPTKFEVQGILTGEMHIFNTTQDMHEVKIDKNIFIEIYIEIKSEIKYRVEKLKQNIFLYGIYL